MTFLLTWWNDNFIFNLKVLIPLLLQNWPDLITEQADILGAGIGEPTIHVHSAWRSHTMSCPVIFPNYSNFLFSWPRMGEPSYLCLLSCYHARVNPYDLTFFFLKSTSRWPLHLCSCLKPKHVWSEHSRWWRAGRNPHDKGIRKSRLSRFENFCSRLRISKATNGLKVGRT